MTKYRIVKWDDGYRVQYKWLWFWLWATTLADSHIEYKTIQEAEQDIKKWNEWEAENGKVVSSEGS